MPMRNPGLAHLLTTSEVAELLGVSVKTVADKRWRLKVGLTPVRVGYAVRFRPRDVERIVRAGRDP